MNGQPPRLESVPDLRHPHETTISDKTALKMTIVQAFAVCGVVAAGSVAWYAEKSSREAHEKNNHVHLDESFEREHGAPVGKWDLTARDEQSARAWAAFQEQVKSLERAQQDLRQQIDDRKPHMKWPPR